jgi:hypothetical protein
MEEIKVGDWVVISGYSQTNESLLRQVRAVTPTQSHFFAGGFKFDKQTGKSFSQDAFGQYKTCTLASEDQVLEYIELREKRSLIKVIQSHLQEYKEIPVEVLESVVNLLES